MSLPKKIASLREKAKDYGVSESIVYVITSLQNMTEELEDLIYSRTRHMITTSGKHTTVGGSTTEEIAVEKACADKQVFVSMETKGAVPVDIVSVKCDFGKIIITFSADPGNDHTIHYMLAK